MGNLDGISDRIFVSKANVEEYYSEFHGPICYIEIKDNFIDKDESIYLIQQLINRFKLKKEEMPFLK
jgi:hypothetical protein